MLSSHKFLFFIFFILFSCADDQPFLHNIVRRASDAILIPCDPYELNATHSCLVFASSYSRKLVVYDATAEAWVLAPNGFFPLPIRVGPGTHRLAKVLSANDKFPFFLALDQAIPALFAVQAFPDKDKKRRGFFTPQEQKLDKSLRPYQIAAWQGESHVFVLLSYRDDKSIGILALDPLTGVLDPQIQPIKIPVGQRPSQIVIDADRKFALISDEESGILHKLDLSNIKDILKNPSLAVFSPSINIGTPADKIYLQKRDFGEGLKSYVVAFKTGKKELRLINIDDNKISSTKALDAYPQAAYFPDEKSEPCCEKSNKSADNRHWIAVADIKGRMTYYLFKYLNNNLSLEADAAQEFDLLSEKNFALSQLQLTSIIGGQVLDDPSLKRKLSCPNNRKMFFIASFGTDRPRTWTYSEAVEVEAQGWTCEGNLESSRFGHKQE